MRYFISKVPVRDARIAVLDDVITRARVSFPSEEGWVVINLSRMESLLDESIEEETAQDEVQEAVLSTGNDAMTAGSLAEAVVMANVATAFELIESRPMVALADAASDFDAVYRYRKGEDTLVSNMLKAEASKLSSEQLEEIIIALTSALDGTYTDEVSAVKMAIMKAVKIATR